MQVALCILTLLIYAALECHTGSPHAQSTVREVSHEDIRDAILSLINIFRDNSDKLERHEARERQLGEQLKKSFALVDRKQGAEESNIVTTLNMLNKINRRLEVLENITTEGVSCKQSSTFNNGQADILLKINNLEQSIKNNEYLLQNLHQKIDYKLESLTQSQLQTQTMATAIHQDLKLFIAAQIQTNAELTSTVNTKLAEIRPHLEKFDKIIEIQSKSVQQTTALLDNAKSSGVIIPDNSTSFNYQQMADMRQAIERDVGLLKEKIGHAEEVLAEKQQIIYNAILKSAKGNEDLKENMIKSYDQLLGEIKGFSKMDKVLIETADNVLDAKRRVEYGTLQILSEIGELIRSTTKGTNDTINKRFDMISNEIVINQNDALKNLSSKIETEISQVWRQIGIMYQTLTSSADALNKLQQQTEIYVNGSLVTMDNMEGKVGQITSRMGEVDENLNYLLGRLSLVTQEFNQIKTGLGDALDNIRSSFQTVQSKVKDTGPGPNPIEDDASSTTDSSLLKIKNSVS